MALPKLPMWTRTPWRTGSSTAQRSPFFATCRPTTSEAQWSTAAKNQNQPSAFVQNRDAAVPHSSSGRSVRIRPLSLRSPQECPRRTGASNPRSRISLSTRFLPTNSVADWMRIYSPESEDAPLIPTINKGGRITGGAMSGTSVARRIRFLTLSALGRAVGPHALRRSLSMATENVRVVATENVRVGQLLCGESVATGAGQLPRCWRAFTAWPPRQ